MGVAGLLRADGVVPINAGEAWIFWWQSFRDRIGLDLAVFQVE
jgi:hypothetical protein